MNILTDHIKYALYFHLNGVFVSKKSYVCIFSNRITDTITIYDVRFNDRIDIRNPERDIRFDTAEMRNCLSSRTWGYPDLRKLRLVANIDSLPSVHSYFWGSVLWVHSTRSGATSADRVLSWYSRQEVVATSLTSALQRPFVILWAPSAAGFWVDDETPRSLGYPKLLKASNDHSSWYGLLISVNLHEKLQSCVSWQSFKIIIAVSYHKSRFPNTVAILHSIGMIIIFVKIYSFPIFLTFSIHRLREFTVSIFQSFCALPYQENTD